jgi:dCTP deaminase
MILSDREIKAALTRGAIRITPNPPAEAWSSTAVDLHLASSLLLWKQPTKGRKAMVDPNLPGFDVFVAQKQFGQKIEMQSSGHVFRSGSFLLGWTIETLWLPHRSRLAARVEGKSRLARLGLGVHVTAPTIHAGFGYKSDDEGYPGSPLQLEIWNIGPLDIKLETGMPICQLIFETVDGTPEKGYEGRFSLQGPTTTA